MTQQALTIAVAPSGLSKLFNALVVSGPAFATALNAEVPADQNLPLGDIGGSSDACDDYVLVLQGGKFSNATATMNSVTQAGLTSANFTMAFSVSANVTYQHWIESYKWWVTGWKGIGHFKHEGPDDLGNYSFSATGMALSAIVKIATDSSGKWQFSFVSAQSNSTAATINQSYPHDSVLNNLNTDCKGHDTVRPALEGALETIDYSVAVAGAISPILAQLSESGKLSASIVFDWTPNVFAFPGTLNTLQAGVTGIVSYNGAAYASNVTPPDLALPDLPAANDVRLFAADALFTSLYWAYFKAGALSQTITPGMIAEQAQLNTAFYKTAIPSLYTTYPNAGMQVVVAQSSAPGITFTAAFELPAPYVLTPAALLGLRPPALSASAWAALKTVENKGYNDLPTFQAALTTALGGEYAIYQAQVVAAASSATLTLGSGGMSSDLYGKLLTQVGVSYATQQLFEAALVNTLGSSAAQQYRQVIENAAAAVIANLNHTPLLTFSVLSNGNYVQVFQIQITETDVLTGFQLAQSGSSQTIQSVYQVQGMPSATLVSSILHDVNVSTIQALWQFTLSGVYASIMQQVAATGVPLPFIHGYTFQNALVTLRPGYADVAADINFLQS
jgi:hypothetical protein